jgi:malonyl-CoA O-methyltransferase
MTSQHSALIAESFGARAETYDREATLQRAVAARLERLMPDFAAPRVLEIGCGTGLFSRHLLSRYPNGTFLLTDNSPGMLSEAERRLGGAPRLRFRTMDGEHPSDGEFDLIALSMVLHWFADPLAALERLRGKLARGGALLYAGIAPGSFAEWSEALAKLGLPNGLVGLPELPGSIEEDIIRPDADGLGFLRRIKTIGGATPRAGYTALPPGALRRAVRALDAAQACVTWRIVYGRLDAN